MPPAITCTRYPLNDYEKTRPHQCVHLTSVLSSAQLRHVTFHPYRSGILKDFRGLSSMTRVGTVLAPSGKKEGRVDGLASTSHVRLTAPTEV
jgi:hypothetical protein